MDEIKVLFSPRGAGSVTDWTDAGYPRVNNVAVCWFVTPDFQVLDRIGYFSSGRWKLLIDDRNPPPTPLWLVAKSSEEAAKMFQLFGSFPGEIEFGNLKDRNDSSLQVIDAMEKIMSTKKRFLPQGFKYKVTNHTCSDESQIKKRMDDLIMKYTKG